MNCIITCKKMSEATPLREYKNFYEVAAIFYCLFCQENIDVHPGTVFHKEKMQKHLSSLTINVMNVIRSNN